MKKYFINYNIGDKGYVDAVFANSEAEAKEIYKSLSKDIIVIDVSVLEKDISTCLADSNMPVTVDYSVDGIKYREVWYCSQDLAKTSVMTMHNNAKIDNIRNGIQTDRYTASKSEIIVHKPYRNEEKKKEQSPAFLFLAIIAVLIVCALMPIIVNVINYIDPRFTKKQKEMPKCSGPFFKKIRQIYLIVGIVFYVIAIGLFILGSVVLKDITYGLLFVFFGGLVYGGSYLFIRFKKKNTFYLEDDTENNKDVNKNEAKETTINEQNVKSIEVENEDIPATPVCKVETTTLFILENEIVELLESYNELKTKNAITQEEYDKKSSEIMSLETKEMDSPSPYYLNQVEIIKAINAYKECLDNNMIEEVTYLYLKNKYLCSNEIIKDNVSANIEYVKSYYDLLSVSVISKETYNHKISMLLYKKVYSIDYDYYKKDQEQAIQTLKYYNLYKQGLLTEELFVDKRDKLLSLDKKKEELEKISEYFEKKDSNSIDGDYINSYNNYLEMIANGNNQAFEEKVYVSPMQDDVVAVDVAATTVGMAEKKADVEETPVEAKQETSNDFETKKEKPKKKSKKPLIIILIIVIVLACLGGGGAGVYYFVMQGNKTNSAKEQEAHNEIYTITFNSTGGTNVASQEVAYGNKVTQPWIPSRTPTAQYRYVFAGWYTDASYQNLFDFNTDIHEDLTLYAKWTTETRTYTVTFNSNGGTKISAQQVSYGNTVNKPADPIRTGYIFKGWFTDSECNNYYDFSSTLKNSITLYAGWTFDSSNYCYVWFVPNNGDYTTGYLVRKGNTVSRPANPSKKGYTFAGWYADETLQTPFDFSEVITSAIYVYAKWE